MPIVRFEPGDEAPRDGTYAVMTPWKTTGVAMWLRQGERLPLLTVTAEGPLWYVLVGVLDEATEAA